MDEDMEPRNWKNTELYGLENKAHNDITFIGFVGKKYKSSAYDLCKHTGCQRACQFLKAMLA